MDLNTILHVRGTETLEFRLSYTANNNRSSSKSFVIIFAMLNDPLKCFGNVTSYFVFNLAISDFLNSLFIMEDSLL